MVGFTEQKKADLVLQQLHRMSENPTFANGGRMYALLVYLVKAQLEGQGRLLNQTTLAIDVFKRDKSFDPNSDSIVRVEVGRLRNKLREYYSLAGKYDIVVISIPKGRYIPSIDINNSDQLSQVNNNYSGFLSANKAWWKSYFKPILFSIIIFSGLYLFLISGKIKDQDSIQNTLTNSVSILTFEDLSPNLNNAFYSVAMREAILNQLQNNNEINVITLEPRISANSDDTLLSSLVQQNIRSYINGSVKVEREEALVQIQLVETVTGNLLWSGRYELEVEDIFSIQSDVVSDIASALNSSNPALEVSTLEELPTDYPDAYALYLKATSSSEPEDRQEFLDQALTIDPGFALAHGTKAFLYSRSITSSAFGPAVAASEREEVERLFRLHAEKALALDPDLTLARVALANFYLYTWHWDQAREIFEQVSTSEPNSPYLITYIALDTYTENYTDAVERLESLIKSNPNFPVFYSLLGGVLSEKGDYQAAAEALRIGLNDASVSNSALIERSLLANAEIHLGNDAVAYQQLRLMEELGANNNTMVLPAMIFAYYRLGRDDDVLRLFSQFERMATDGAFISSGSWAEVYFALGQHEKALTSLRLVVEKVKLNEPDENFMSLMRFLTKMTNDPYLNSSDSLALRSQFLELRKQILFN